MIYIVVSISLIVGILIGILLTYRHVRVRLNEATAYQYSLKNTVERLDEQQKQIDNLISERNDLLKREGIHESTIESLKQQLNQKQNEFHTLQKQLTSEFENIATRILRERGEEWNQQSKGCLDTLLAPLSKNIEDFKQQVRDAYERETRDKSSLKEEVRKLTELNAQVSHEANNLTKALKGDVKQQGNWGELVLERILEMSGLTEGETFFREQVVKGMSGEILRPDVIIKLPDNKHIIIDSKVSLTHYEQMLEASDKTTYDALLKNHIASIKRHVTELSAKNYSNAHGLNSPEFVIMFIPIESSFALALKEDVSIFEFAWDRKIIIVSPTTLLATLRTVANIWKQEKRSQNAQEIARLSGTLYDKVCGLIGDLEKVKTNLSVAERSADDAIHKLSEGNGNIVKTLSKIKDLGAKCNKELPAELTT